MRKKHPVPYVLSTPPELHDLEDAWRYFQSLILRQPKGGVAHIHAETLYKIVGKSAAVRIFRYVRRGSWKQDDGFYRSPCGIEWKDYKNFSDEQQSRCFRFGPDVTPRRHTLQSDRINRAISEYGRRLRKSFKPFHTYICYWAKLVDLPSVLPPDLQAKIDGMYPYHYLEAFRTWEYAEVDTFGHRLHNRITSLPSWLRKLVTINGRRLVEIDIANCQPLIMAAVVVWWWRKQQKQQTRSKNGPHPSSAHSGRRQKKPTVSVGDSSLSDRDQLPDDLKEYIVLCESGQLYEKLMREIGLCPGGLLEHTRPTNLKAKGRQPWMRDVVVALAEAFSRLFPHVTKAVRAMKSAPKGSTKDYTELVKRMQRLESSLMLEHVVGEELMEKNIPLVTVHDCIMTTPEHVETVISAIERQFRKQIGMNPTVTVGSTATDETLKPFKATFKKCWFLWLFGPYRSPIQFARLDWGASAKSNPIEPPAVPPPAFIEAGPSPQETSAVSRDSCAVGCRPNVNAHPEPEGSSAAPDNGLSPINPPDVTVSKEVPAIRQRRQRPRYSRLTLDFANHLLPLIDPLDWGYDGSNGTPIYATDNGRLEIYYQKIEMIFPQRLTRTTIQRHLQKKDRLHYTSRRTSGFALLMFDVDAHSGQTDAHDTAVWLRDTYFRGAYLEPSRRGYHLYVCVRVREPRRTSVNALAASVERDLRILLDDRGFESTVEVRGTFTEVRDGVIYRRGKLAAMPTLPHGSESLRLLVEAPVHLPRALYTILDHADMIAEFHEANTTGCGDLEKGEQKWVGDVASNRTNPPKVLPENPSLLEVCVSRSPHDRFRRLETSDAYDRMTACCWDFTLVHKRLPVDEDELLDAYAAIYGHDGERGMSQRRRRARDVLTRRMRTFRPDKAQATGYRASHTRLLSAVRLHCTDRTSGYRCRITDEDLAVALYVVERNSRPANRREKWKGTCGYDAFRGMFRELKNAGVISRGFNRNKVTALKLILQRAGLIDCTDSRYIPAGKGRGVAMKYSVTSKAYGFDMTGAMAQAAA